MKIIWDSIGEHVTYAFNNILTKSYFPNVWKYSLLTPVEKISRPMSINDYRPISLIPIFSKILEIIMKTQMNSHLDGINGIAELQSGFRKYHNSTSAVLKICEDIRKNINKKYLTILLLLDFSKAFDHIDHSILC